MRLRPGAAQTAAQGWADPLAVFSLEGPVFLLATTVVTGLLLVRVAPGLLNLPAGWWLRSRRVAGSGFTDQYCSTQREHVDLGR